MHYIVKLLFCFIQNIKNKVNLEGLCCQVNRITFWTLMDSEVSVKVMKGLTCYSVLNESDMLVFLRRVLWSNLISTMEKRHNGAFFCTQGGWKRTRQSDEAITILMGAIKNKPGAAFCLPAVWFHPPYIWVVLKAVCLSTLLLFRHEVSIKYLWICLNFEWLPKAPSSSIAQLYKVKPGSIKACLIFAGAFCPASNINEAV